MIPNRPLHWTLALTIVMTSGVALAQAPPKAYQDAYLDGEREYNLGNLEKAEELFSKAVKLFPGPPGPYRYLAAIAQERGREETEEAKKKAFYIECLRNAHIAVSKSPKSSKSKPVRQLHAECRDGLRRPRFQGEFPANSGAVAVVTETMGAQVKINGASRGGTPFKPRSVGVGRATVAVIYKGQVKTGSVDVVEGLVSDFVAEFEESAVGPTVDPTADPTADPSLDPSDPVNPSVDPATTVTATTSTGALVKHGWVVVTAPEGATLRFDGKPAATDEQGRIKADEGTYPVTVEKPGHESWRRRVRVIRGQQKQLVANLKSFEERDSQRRKGYVALGVAGAFTLGGAAFGIVGLSARADAIDIQSTESRRPAGGNTTAFEPLKTRDDIADANKKSDTYQVLAAVSLGAAAVALGTAVYFFVNERSEQIAGQEPPLVMVPVSAEDGALAGAALQFSGSLDW